MKPAAVTVVVPTRNRPESLARCLAALARQTLRDALEVIVVQDGEDVPALAVPPGIRLIRQSRAGPGAARNRGAREATADVLCFTDDDCEPLPTWAESLAGALAEADAAVGPTINAAAESALAISSQLVVRELTESALHAGRVYAPASNMGARRDVFLAVHFDDRRFQFAGGDRDWCDRIQRAGHSLVYVEDAVVRHRQQLSMHGFLRQHYAYGRGAYRFHRGRGFEPPSFYTRLLARGFESGGRVGLLTLIAQGATAVGYGRELLATRTLRPALRARRPRRSSRASASGSSRSSPS